MRSHVTIEGEIYVHESECSSTYSVRVFDSATGHRWFQVVGPFGRVFESLDVEAAKRDCAVRNARRAVADFVHGI